MRCLEPALREPPISTSDEPLCSKDISNSSTHKSMPDSSPRIHEHKRMPDSSFRVLELGCGLGLASITAAFCGATEVVASDGDADVLEMTRRNIIENGVRETVVAKQYLWNEKTKEFSSQPFDLILCADIIYLEETYTDLCTCLRDLSHDGTHILMSYKMRFGHQLKCFQKLKRYFHWTMIDRSRLHHEFQDGPYELALLTKKCEDDEYKYQ
eukprot:998249_1